MKQKILNLCSSLLQLSIIVSLFIPNFVTYLFTENNTSIMYKFGLFANFSDAIKINELAGRTFTTAFMTITSVLLIILTIVAAAHFIMVILDLLGVKIKVSNKIKKILSAIAILIGILVLICMLITTFSNIFETKSLFSNEIISKEITYGTGTCFAFASIIGGALGLFDAKTKKQKRSKKKSK